MMMSRLAFQSLSWDYDSDKLGRFYGIIVFGHMFLSLGWLIVSLTQWKNMSEDCMRPVTLPYINYLLITFILLPPAFTLLGLICMGIICLPCIFQKLYLMFHD